MKELSPRERWLSQAGLRMDPFITPAAEQEVERLDPQVDQRMQSSEGDLLRDIPDFYELFYEPMLLDSAGKTVAFERLRDPCPYLIFGEPGSGKTTLKFNLERHIRTRLDGTLSVTYDLGDQSANRLDLDAHCRRLARDLATDLVLQYLEQYPADSVREDEKIVSLLKQQVALGARSLTRVLEAVRDFNPEKDPLDLRAGISRFWGRVSRRAVRYVAPSPALTRLARAVLESKTTRSESSGEALFWSGIETAQSLGFHKILVLVDGADARDRDLTAMTALVSPLLELMEKAVQRQVYFRLFLTSDLKPEVQQLLELPPLSGLRSIIHNATIIWNKDALQDMLAQRFKAAGAPAIHNLDVLAGPDMEQGLESPVFELVGASPRALVRLVNALIDAHLQKPASDIFFSSADWRRALQIFQQSS